VRGALQLLLNYCQLVKGKGKGKGKVRPINCHEDPKWGVEVGQYLYSAFNLCARWWCGNTMPA